MHDLICFQQDLLVVTSGLEDPKGLEIKEALEDYSIQDVNLGGLYPILNDFGTRYSNHLYSPDH